MTKRLWAGLDVGVETTSVCIIDDKGETLHEASCPTALKSVRHELAALRRRRAARVALEASTGMTLARGLRSLGYSVDLYDSHQLSRFLRIRRNKTDAADAVGIADACRLGVSGLSKVHLKSLEGQRLQSRLAIRRHLIRQRVASINMIGRQLELYGGRLDRSRTRHLHSHVEAEIRRLFGRVPNELTRELRYMVAYCEQLLAHEREVDCELRELAAGNEICRRFMEIPGVGPLCALTFYAAVDDPRRFHRTADIGCYFGLTPRIKQSGLSMRLGRISRMGNSAVRALLVNASMSFMRYSSPDCDLRRWAAGIEQRGVRGKARVALARKLATVMLAIWKSGEPYRQRCSHGLID